MYPKKKSIYLRSIMVIVIIIVITFFYYLRIINTTVNDDEQQNIFAVESGTSIDSITNDLVSGEFIKSALAFRIYLKLNKLDNDIQAGQHYLSSAMTIKEIARRLTTPTYQEERSLTFIEGWTNKEMAEYLAASDIIATADFINALEQKYNYDFLPQKGQQDYLQGYLFPDTYRIFADTNAQEIIVKLLNNFSHKVMDNLQEQIDHSSMTLEEIITLASIIEHEVRTPSDRAMVADIFLRRLADNYPLQSDATVNYITNKGMTQPTFVDTKIDSLYNTYKYAGLPPGPICNPSLSAIKAVLNPITNDYYFFLTTNDDGRVIYSRNYEEHLTNKAIYLD
ncbi:MAG: endolytic transglycosylase MltG [Candidatus Komeilibacteria bacterium]